MRSIVFALRPRICSVALGICTVEPWRSQTPFLLFILFDLDHWSSVPHVKVLTTALAKCDLEKTLISSATS